MMTRKFLTRLISDHLCEKLQMEELKAIRSLLDGGALGNVISNAVDKAIESKSSEEFWATQVPGTDGQDHESYSDTQDHETYMVDDGLELE